MDVSVGQSQNYPDTFVSGDNFESTVISLSRPYKLERPGDAVSRAIQARPGQAQSLEILTFETQPGIVWINPCATFDICIRKKIYEADFEFSPF